MARRPVFGAALALVLTALAVAGCQGAPADSPTSVGPGPAAGTGASTTGPGDAWSGWTPCPGALPAYRCGTLSVPLDRSDPGSRRLPLPVVVGGDLTAGRTLLFLTGGPGQGGVAAAPRVVGRLGAVAEQQRVVLLDQRGTGAGALSCPDLQRQMGASDLAVPSESAVTSCAQTLGPDRAHYATTDTVADLEDLRAALGAERWSLDGVSYGSYVAQRYAAAHPDRVDRLVLDSAVPVAGFDPLLTDVYPEVARVLRLLCAASACPGDPVEALTATVRRYPDLSPALLDLATTMSVADPTFPGLVPALVAAAGSQDQPLRTLVAQWRRGDTTAAGSLSQGLHASTLCLDLDFPWGGADSPAASRSSALSEAVARVPPERFLPFDAGAARGNGEVVTCRLWAQTADGWSAADAATARAALAPVGPRALVLAGDRDLSTPLVWARATAASLPGSRLVVVPGAGHSVQSRGPASAAAEATAWLLHP